LRTFARERGVSWNRYYDPVKSFGTVTATATFAIPSTVYKLSIQEGDYLRITHTDGTFTDYERVLANRLKEYDTGNYYAKVRNTIKFNSPFTATSPQFGGTITVPVYEYPTVFSADGDVIDHDNPDYLVCMTAADRVKNDVTRKDLRNDLLLEATDIMMSLKEENDEAPIDDLTRTWNPIDHVGSEY